MMTYQMQIYSGRSSSQGTRRNCKLLEEGKAPEDLLANKRKILVLKATPFTLMNGYLYKLGIDNILRICTLEHEHEDIINEVHAGPA
jgi:hypothetical protein